MVVLGASIATVFLGERGLDVREEKRDKKEKKG